MGDYVSIRGNWIKKSDIGIKEQPELDKQPKVVTKPKFKKSKGKK